VRTDEQITLALQSLLQTLRQVQRPALWMPWLLLGALQVLALAALCGMAHPWLSLLMAPLVARLAGSEALHYPDLFVALPGLYARVDLLLVALPGAVAGGASAALFAAAFRGRDPRPGAACGQALGRAVRLVAVNLPYHVLASALGFAIAIVGGSRGGIVGAAAYVFALGGSVFLQSAFLYVNALVMIEGCGIRSAFAELPRTWRSGFVSALVLGTLLLLPLLPLNLLGGAGGLIASKGRPELVAAILAAQIGIAVCMSVLLSGAATLVFLTAMSRRADPEDA
jgi:hypothetical protein